MYLLRDHSPRFKDASAAATRRARANISASECSAAATALPPGALTTTMPRAVAAATSMVSTPAPARPITRKRGEWSRSRYIGSELSGKTLGLIGLGRVGSEVARRAQGLDMRVIVFDPYVPDEHVQRIGLEPAELAELLASSDFVSLHVPLTEATRGILNAERIAAMRPSAFVINCARGGLVDEPALLAALDEGRLAGAGIDVFGTEPVPAGDPLPRHPKVVATPHLGASTVEAQANVATQVAHEVLAVLAGRPTQFAVNVPSLRPEDVEALQPYLGLVVMLGKLATQLADDHVRSAEISYRGEIAERNVGVLTAAAVQGLLEPISATPVNLVNARLLAQQRGLDVVETRSSTPSHYTSLVRVTVNTRAGATSVAGVISDGRANVVQIDDYELHLPPTPGYLLVTQHVDRPGMIGLVGTLLGEADINISSMQVGRKTRRGEALMLLSVDEPVPPAVVEHIRHAASVATIKVIKL